MDRASGEHSEGLCAGGRPFAQAAEVAGFAGNAAARVSDAVAFEESKRRACTRDRKLGYASACSGAAVLANTLTGGSGTLAAAHAFSEAGWLLGWLLVVVCCCASAFGSHLLHCSARRIGKAPCSFCSVCQEAVPRWTWLVDGAVMAKCFGVGTAYLIIVGDLAPPAVEFLLGASGVRRWHAVTVGFVAAGSLACLRDLSPLRYTATAAVAITFWTVVMIVLFYCRIGTVFEPCGSPTDDLPCAGSAVEPVAPQGFLRLGKALPLFIFGFTCQQNVFTICNEVKGASRVRMDSIIVSAYTIAGVFFTLIALFAYATYGDGVSPDALKGYPQNAVLQVTRLLYALIAVFSYPLQAHPSRASCLSLWSLSCGPPWAAGGAAALTAASAGARRGLSEPQRFRAATALGLSLSYLVAVTVQDLSAVLGVVGATGSTMVSYILPGFFYTQTFHIPHLKRTLAFVQLGAGCVIMPACLALVLFGK